MPASFNPVVYDFINSTGVGQPINNGLGYGLASGNIIDTPGRVTTFYLRWIRTIASGATQFATTPPTLDSASSPFNIVHARLGFWFRIPAYPVGGNATIVATDFTGPDVVGRNKLMISPTGKLIALAGSIGAASCTDRDEVRTLNPLALNTWHYLVFDTQVTNGKTFPSDSSLADGYGVRLFVNGNTPALDPLFGSVFGWGVYAGRRAVSNFTFTSWRLGPEEAVDVEMNFDHITLGGKVGGSTIVLPIGKNFTFDGSNCILAGTSAIFAHAPDCVGGSFACGCVSGNDCPTIFPIFGFSNGVTGEGINYGLPAGPNLESDVPLFPFFIQTQPSAPAAENVVAGAAPGAPASEGDSPLVPPCDAAGCSAQFPTLGVTGATGCSDSLPTVAGGCPT